MNDPSVEHLAQRPSEDSAAELDRLAMSIPSLETIVAGWDDTHQLTVHGLKTAIEDLYKHALKRLIRVLKDDPVSMAHCAGTVVVSDSGNNRIMLWQLAAPKMR